VIIKNDIRESIKEDSNIFLKEKEKISSDRKANKEGR
jgi:hypothetical protein